MYGRAKKLAGPAHIPKLAKFSLPLDCNPRELTVLHPISVLVTGRLRPSLKPIWPRPINWPQAQQHYYVYLYARSLARRKDAGIDEEAEARMLYV